MAKGIKRSLKIALRNAEAEIRDFGSRSRLASAMATEGYTGGYIQALNDVILALNGVHPNSRFWKYDDIGKQTRY